MNSTHIRICNRCHQAYDWRRSASGSLKMTYCGSLCERADLGFTLEALLGEVQRVKLDIEWKQLLAA
jgi:hypothetical protein